MSMKLKIRILAKERIEGKLEVKIQSLKRLIYKIRSR